MTRAEIIHYVMGLIDEVSAEGLENPVPHIERQLDKSAEFVLKNAPDQMVISVAKNGTGHFVSSPQVSSRLVINEDGSGLFVLPTDFVRLISFKLSSWSRPIYDLLNNKDPRYNLQKNGSRRGNKYQPIGALVPFVSYIASEIRASEPNANYALELFSTDETADTVSQLIYIPETLPENFPEKLLESMSWICASKCLAVLRRYDESKEAERRATIEMTAFKLGEKGD